MASNGGVGACQKKKENKSLEVLIMLLVRDGSIWFGCIGTFWDVWRLVLV